VNLRLYKGVRVNRVIRAVLKHRGSKSCGLFATVTILDKHKDLKE
jgi:hypothetical protein